VNLDTILLFAIAVGIWLVAAVLAYGLFVVDSEGEE